MPNMHEIMLVGGRVGARDGVRQKGTHGERFEMEIFSFEHTMRACV